jgi:hypothetical protein
MSHHDYLSMLNVWLVPELEHMNLVGKCNLGFFSPTKCNAVHYSVFVFLYCELHVSA